MPSLAEYQGAVEILGRLWVCPPIRTPRSALYAVVFCRPPDALAFRFRGGGARLWAWRQEPPPDA